MGALTGYLQQEFARLSPAGWKCGKETELLSPDLRRLLGYRPHADVVLEHPDGLQRLWIEFEVSRADPVANHAKFATAHFFSPQRPGDTFVAMVSPHVDRGRRNLATGMVMLMRSLGMNALQTALFPTLPPQEVKRLNHLALDSLTREGPSVEPEIERVLAVSRPLLSLPGRRIHFVGELFEVMANLRQWNLELSGPGGAELWGRRTITYFVHDPGSGDFAPSKFCAYLPIALGISPWMPSPAASGGSLMSLELYATLDQRDGPFDGKQAWSHLTRRLGMVPRTPSQLPATAALFNRWLARLAGSVTLHPAGPVLLLPPEWFR